MNLELWVLALASAVRPTALAAVYALLGTPRPRRLLTVYIAAGLTVSLATGIIVIEFVEGAELGHERGTLDGVLELLAGSAAIGFATGLYSGRVQRSPKEPRAKRSAIARRLRDPSAKVAATAGVATHLPGLFYLVALNSILAESDSLTPKLVNLVVYNAVWWSLPVASLVFFILNPSGTLSALARLNEWGRRHQRQILTVIFALVGAFLIVKGTAELIG